MAWDEITNLTCGAERRNPNQSSQPVSLLYAGVGVSRNHHHHNRPQLVLGKEKKPTPPPLVPLALPPLPDQGKSGL